MWKEKPVEDCVASLFSHLSLETYSASLKKRCDSLGDQTIALSFDHFSSTGFDHDHQTIEDIFYISLTKKEKENEEETEKTPV